MKRSETNRQPVHETSRLYYQLRILEKANRNKERLQRTQLPRLTRRNMLGEGIDYRAAKRRLKPLDNCVSRPINQPNEPVSPPQRVEHQPSASLTRAVAGH
jgi:hypothetical protein